MIHKLRPRQSGNKIFVSQYGKRLLCVRYHYDATRAKRFKTVELIIEESDWQPPARPFRPDELVGIQIGVDEMQWRQRVKTAGGKWNPARKLWEIEYAKVRKLGLINRIQTTDVSANGNITNHSQRAKLSISGKSNVSTGGN